MEIKSKISNQDYFATICSIAPMPLNEIKPGLYPGDYRIPACKNMHEDVEVLVVGECHFNVYLDLERGSFPVRTPAVRIATSIINDFINAQLAVDEDAYPGLFMVLGILSKEDVKKQYPEMLDEARTVQLRWFQRLVSLADDDWEKYRQHRAVSGTQRQAAKALGLKRDWIVEPQPIKPKVMSCLVCRTPLDPETILCPACNFIVNPEEYEKIKDRFAVQTLNTKE